MDYKAKFSSQSAEKVDVHHHLVPDFWETAVSTIGLGPEEIPPKWSLEGSEDLMEAIGTTTTIFSLTTPGTTFLPGQPGREMSRRVNEYCAKIRDSKPGKFGFFATLPSLLDTDGAIEEIRHALGKLRAEGVILFTRYGDDNYYLGHESFRPIWKELNTWKAVVLVHPCMPRDRTPFPRTLLPNISEFPHETTRTALDLIFSNTKRDNPDCKIILSHAGGTLPYLAGRVSFMEVLPSAPVKKTRDEIDEEIKSFYFDLALSGHKNALNCLLGFVPHDHILFGSDYPFAPKPGALRMNDGWEGYEVDQELRDKINFRNARKILPMFKGDEKL
jgi:predicted TIM-barrel fold metal-dependent hydrolase